MPVFSAALLIAAQSVTFAPQAPAPTPPPPQERPLTQIFQNLGKDLVDFPGLDTLVILGTGGVVASIAHNSDHKVDRWTLTHPPGSWTHLGEFAGNGATLGGAAIATWAVGKLSNKSLMTHVGSDLIRVQMLNGVFTTGVKYTVNRRRPSGGKHAFPSGHTSASFAAAGVLQQHFGWKVGAPAMAASSFIAYTRIRDRVHWLSDVAFGAAVGLASARAVTRGHQSRTWSVMPVAVPGGAGLVFVKVGASKN